MARGRVLELDFGVMQVMPWPGRIRAAGWLFTLTVPAEHAPGSIPLVAASDHVPRGARPGIVATEPPDASRVGRFSRVGHDRRVSRAETARRPLVATPTAAVIDVVLVVVFAAVGRGSHGENVLVGLAGTAWPFLLGLLVGWVTGLLAYRGRFDARRIAPGGMVIWAGTLGVGMLARAVAGQGTAPSFIVVAGVVLALFLLGWRALAILADRHRRA
jgi:hypothetical protein